MSIHPREHQDFVDRILGGELDESDASVRARLEACPACRDELEHLRSLDAGLRAAARQVKDDLERARSQVLASDEALVRVSLREALSDPGFGRPRSPARFRLLALAAGLLLLLGLGAFLYLRAGHEHGEILLHGGTLRCISPVGEVDDYDEFSWSGTLPAQGSFVLTIRVLEDDGAGTLLQTIPCQEPRWTPTPEERRALPDRIQWSVEARDLTEKPVDTGSAKASRRSRSR